MDERLQQLEQPLFQQVQRKTKEQSQHYKRNCRVQLRHQQSHTSERTLGGHVKCLASRRSSVITKQAGEVGHSCSDHWQLLCDQKVANFGGQSTEQCTSLSHEVQGWSRQLFYRWTFKCRRFGEARMRFVDHYAPKQPSRFSGTLLRSNSNSWSGASKTSWMKMY